MQRRVRTATPPERVDVACVGFICGVSPTAWLQSFLLAASEGLEAQALGLQLILVAATTEIDFEAAFATSRFPSHGTHYRSVFVPRQ